MAKSVAITSFQLLEELDDALARYAARSLEAISEAEREIETKLADIDRIALDREMEANRWRRTYDEADSEEDDIGFIQRRLEEAEDALQEAMQWRSRTEESYSAYRSRSKQAVHLADEHTAKARVFLKGRIAELYDYVQLKPGIDSGVVFNLPANQPETLVANRSDAGASSDPVLQPGTEPAYEMTELALPMGFAWVRLDELTPSEMDQLPSNNDYRKDNLSVTDMRDGLHLLRTRILPEIEKNPAAANREHFEQLDALEGRTFPNSLAPIFSAYLGTRNFDDIIVVERFRGDKFFSITNGRHRIKAALDSGWNAIPARVTEVDRR